MNYNKTQFLQFFARKQNTIPIQIITSNSILHNINSTKFLGLTLDSMLSWSEHITALTHKLNKPCFAIRAIKPFMTTRVLKWFTTLIFTRLCRMVLFSGVHFTSILIYLEYKRE